MAEWHGVGMTKKGLFVLEETKGLFDHTENGMQLHWPVYAKWWALEIFSVVGAPKMVLLPQAKRKVALWPSWEQRVPLRSGWK